MYYIRISFFLSQTFDNPVCAGTRIVRLENAARALVVHNQNTISLQKDKHKKFTKIY